jgi:hypothetical protein
MSSGSIFFTHITRWFLFPVAFGKINPHINFWRCFAVNAQRRGSYGKSLSNADADHGWVQ